MLVLLPPSETKLTGGRGPALDLESLSLPSLTAARSRLITAVRDLAGDVDASRLALGLSAKQDDEIAHNQRLMSSATTPALLRYTGVLYDALAARTFTRVQREKAFRRLAIGSALFGAVRSGDLIPAYRLSGGSQLPGFGTLAAYWRETLVPALVAETHGELVVDLRSGSYRQLGKVPGAVTADVVTERADGSRTVVSHFNKHHKGLLARALVVSRAEPTTIDGVARVARNAGLRIEVSGPHDLVIVTSA